MTTTALTTVNREMKIQRKYVRAATPTTEKKKKKKKKKKERKKEKKRKDKTKERILNVITILALVDRELCQVIDDIIILLSLVQALLQHFNAVSDGDLGTKENQR